MNEEWYANIGGPLLSDIRCTCGHYGTHHDYSYDGDDDHHCLVDDCDCLKIRWACRNCLVQLIESNTDGDEMFCHHCAGMKAFV